MNRLFREFENENALRTYPFASGCLVKDTKGISIGTGVLIDAALYPINPKGKLYLSKVSKDGIVSISDDSGVIMASDRSSGHDDVLELYDVTGLKRHTGTLVFSSKTALDVFTGLDTDRNFRRTATVFASACVFPIVDRGVTSLDIGNSGITDGMVTFDNGASDTVRVSTSGNRLRFDVIPDPNIVDLTSIRHIYCVVDGATPFRILKLPFDIEKSSDGNTISLYLDGIGKDDVCSNSHREDSLEMHDSCEDCKTDECHVDPAPPVDMPEVYQAECVDIEGNMDSAFYIVSDNMAGYVNPISITLENGVVSKKTALNVTTTSDNVAELTDEVTSNGVKIQVPGLNTSL